MRIDDVYLQVNQLYNTNKAKALQKQTKQAAKTLWRFPVSEMRIRLQKRQQRSLRMCVQTA